MISSWVRAEIMKHQNGLRGLTLIWAHWFHLSNVVRMNELACSWKLHFHDSLRELRISAIRPPGFTPRGSSELSKPSNTLDATKSDPSHNSTVLTSSAWWISQMFAQFCCLRPKVLKIPRKDMTLNGSKFEWMETREATDTQVKARDSPDWLASKFTWLLGGFWPETSYLLAIFAFSWAEASRRSWAGLILDSSPKSGGAGGQKLALFSQLSFLSPLPPLFHLSECLQAAHLHPRMEENGEYKHTESNMSRANKLHLPPDKN